MRMRLAHTSAVHHTQTERQQKKICGKQPKRQTKRMEHKLMFYDYFMIFMDRILCDRNLFIFFLLVSLIPSHHCRCSRCGFGSLSYCWALQILLHCMHVYMWVLVFPRQFIIDIMLSFVFFFFFFFWCVCVWGNVCRRAHVQEMWDRLCFYCIAWPKIDGNSVTKHSAVQGLCTLHIFLLIIHLSLFTRSCCSLRETKCHHSLPEEENRKTLFTLEPASFRSTHVAFIFFKIFFPFFWCESIEKNVNDLAYLRMWIGHNVCQNFCRRTPHTRYFVDSFDRIVSHRFVSYSLASWALYFVALNLDYLNLN